MKTTKYQNGGSAGQSISSKGAYYPDAKCRAEGCPKNPNDPKYKKEVAKLTPQQKQKIGAKYQNGGPVEAMYKAMGKKEPSLKKTLKYVKKNGSGLIPSNPATQRPNTDSYKSAGTSIKTAKRPNTKYQDGGMTGAEMKAKGMGMKTKGEGMKLKGQGQAMKVEGKKMQAEGDVLKYAGQNPVRTKISKSLGLPLQSRPTGIAGTYMKTGGMVNSNAKIAADKTPGSKGVKSGVNPKAAASKVARGKVGGTSTSPKTAVPKMAMGGTRPGMAKAGSKKYQTGGPTAEQQIESGVRKNYIANAKAKLMGVAAAARKSSGRRGKI